MSGLTTSVQSVVVGDYLRIWGRVGKVAFIVQHPDGTKEIGVRFERGSDASVPLPVTPRVMVGRA